MLNDVIFNNEISAYNDWGIMLTEKDIPLPEPKISAVDIQGSDGVLDLSTALTGDIKFKNRSVKLTFEIMDVTDYYNLISEISNYLHGKIITFSFKNDDDFYYKGRTTINQWQCSKNTGTIVINVDAEPYKLEKNKTTIQASLNNETKKVVLQNLRQVVCPDLTVTGAITLTFNDEEFELEAGNYQLMNLILTNGNNIITLQGTGTVKFTYQRGSL